jgi:hypothetical protein
MACSGHLVRLTAIDARLAWIWLKVAERREASTGFGIMLSGSGSNLGLPVLPLAPVADVEPEQVPGVLVAISERFVQETSLDQAATLWAATKVLMGLR